MSSPSRSSLLGQRGVEVGGVEEEGRETEARMNAWRGDPVTQLYPYPFNDWVTVSLLQDVHSSLCFSSLLHLAPTHFSHPHCVSLSLRKLGEAVASLGVPKGRLPAALLFPRPELGSVSSSHWYWDLGHGGPFEPLSSSVRQAC